MKKIILFVMLLSFIPVIASLNIFIDENKFLDEKSNTNLDITYQIPYNELSFLKSAEGFKAQMKINYQILKEEKILVDNNFIQDIIVRNEELTKSLMTYKDKLTLTLSKSGYQVVINFQDIVSEEFTSWKHDFDIISPDALVSELEFSKQAYMDTTSVSNLKRGNIYFDIAVDHLYNKPSDKDVIAYYEIQNFFSDADGNVDISETIQIFKDDQEVKTLSDKITIADGVIRRIKDLDISDFDKGYYKINLKIKDNLTGFEETREDFFLIKEKIYTTVRMFPSLEDEIKLIKYFVSATKISNWNSMSKESKKNLVDQFWKTNDPNPATEENEFFDLVKERVQYANEKFSHFADGWGTDRGRIYVKNGAPDEISTTKTGFYTKYAQKDVAIWKYRYSQNLTYLFIDFNTNGNHKLVYNENDDEEDIYPDWLDFLGEEFDQSLLQ